MRSLGVRWKLTLWYGVSIAFLLSIFGGLVYRTMGRKLIERIDEELRVEFDEIVGTIEHDRGRGRLLERLHREFDVHEGVEFQVSKPDGTVVFRSLVVRWVGLPGVPIGLARARAATREVGVEGLGKWRRMVGVARSSQGLLIVQDAYSLRSYQQAMAELLLVMAGAGVPAIVLSLVGGYLLARKALSPVDRMSAQAAAITARDLDQRLAVPNQDDELARLARTINALIERIERSFEETRRFTGDAAHELRTPLAVMHSAIEVALRHPRDQATYQRTLKDLLEEVERLTRLAEQLLLLSREDARSLPRVRQRTRLDDLARDVVGPMAAAGAECGIAVSLGETVVCEADVDPDQIRRVLINLIDNAIRYTAAGGSITVSALARDPRHVRISVADNGSGIAPEHIPVVFARFYRADGSRGQECSGAGLGLAICQAIIEAHSGRIWIESTLGKGTTVVFELEAQTNAERVDRAKAGSQPLLVERA